jgi:hypothetical protein
MTQEEGKAKVAVLVASFVARRAGIMKPDYLETTVRTEFLDDFFTALGWDIKNHERPGEVHLEKSQDCEDGRKGRADYEFSLGHGKTFYVEAKKPSENLERCQKHAVQARMYAYSAKHPVVILTDFEEFSVYLGRGREPKAGDKVDTALIPELSCKYTDYLDKWDILWGAFSRESVRSSSLERLPRVEKAGKGEKTVDSLFLADIESWRNLLASNIHQNHPELSRRTLNEVVQQTIDRIIFLRICEDRDIENYGRIQRLQGKAGVYKGLCTLFREADDYYNSGLFHFKAEKGRGDGDASHLDLVIDNAPLDTIIDRLYFPGGPYAFAAMPADILGQVYERFLGKVIEIGDAGKVVIQEKPEVKKAGGVFYTPEYIVDYIVKNTVGRLLDQKTLEQVAELKILDPACGSGAFLINAYQCLLDWHLEWYKKNKPEKWRKEKKIAAEERLIGDEKVMLLRLTMAERKRILLAHIHGVDIDKQAVEVTKLSLLLKCLEGETKWTLQGGLFDKHHRVLPDLAGNIKCGNSLIGTDFDLSAQLTLLEGEELDDALAKVNVFDWKRGFPTAFAQGGFDAVIGNPPYVRQETLTESKAYFQEHYTAYDGVADLYVYFMEKGIRLLRTGGYFGIIVSSSFLRTRFAAPLRNWLKANTAIERMVDFGGLPVFTNAKDAYVCIPILRKGEASATVPVCQIPELNLPGLEQFVLENSHNIPLEQLTAEAWSLKKRAENELFAKVMAAGVPLGQYVEKNFFRGITSGLNEAFVIDAATRNSLIAKDPKSAELIKPVFGGEEIRRYVTRPKGQFIIFTRRGVEIGNYQAIHDHLSQWKADLTPKQSKDDKKGRKPGRYKWYEIQDDVAYYRTFEAPKIIFPDITKEPRFVLDNDGHYLTNTAYCLGTDDRYLLGILNSRLFWFAIANISIPFGVRAGQYRYRLIYQYMKKVPIRVVDPDNPTDVAARDEIIKNVDMLVKLQKQLTTATNKELLQNQIEITNTKLNDTVYKLYGLTEDETKIVGG